MYCRSCGEQFMSNEAVCAKCNAKRGDGAAFCPKCGKSTPNGVFVCPHCRATFAPAIGSGSKPKLVAALLAIFLGWLGVHSFYLGYRNLAFIKCGISLASFILAFFIPFAGLGMTAMGLWGLYDGIMILIGKITADADGNPFTE